MDEIRNAEKSARNAELVPIPTDSEDETGVRDHYDRGPAHVGGTSTLGTPTTSGTPATTRGTMALYLGDGLSDSPSSQSGDNASDMASSHSSAPRTCQYFFIGSLWEMDLEAFENWPSAGDELILEASYMAEYQKYCHDASGRFGPNTQYGSVPIQLKCKRS